MLREPEEIWLLTALVTQVAAVLAAAEELPWAKSCWVQEGHPCEEGEVDHRGIQGP